MRGTNACLVVTPRDGKNLARISEIREIFGKAGWNVRVAVEGYSGQAVELAREAVQQNSDLVIAYGGDGTVNQVVNGVMEEGERVQREQPCVVGVIPGGTVNLWAVEIGMPPDPVEAAQALIESVVRPVDLGYVSVQNAPQDGQKNDRYQTRQHFLLMTGLGFDAEVMGHVDRSLKHKLGIIAVGLAAAGHLPELRPFSVSIEGAGDGRRRALKWHGEALQVMVSNTRQHANNANSWEMAPGAYVDDGLLDICVIMPDRPLKMVRQALSLMFKRIPDKTTAKFFRAPSFSVTLPASTAMQLDGDLMDLAPEAGPSSVTYQFRVLPHVMHMAIPSTSNNIIFKAS